MRDLLPTLCATDKIIHRLNPTAMLTKLDEYTRAGLPGSSIPNGSRSADVPMPHFDRADEKTSFAIQHAYEREMVKMHAAAVRLRELESSVLVADYMTPKQLLEYHKRMSRLATELKSPTAVQCANCHRHVERTANDRLRRGRCHACYEYLSTHDGERPRELWEQDVERQLTQTANRDTIMALATGLEPA